VVVILLPLLLLMNAVIHVKNLVTMAIQYAEKDIVVVLLLVNGYVVLVMVLPSHVRVLNKDRLEQHVLIVK